jgi:hypothetical protein
MDSDQRWTKDRGMRGRLPTFAAVVIYGLISSFSSAGVCRRFTTEPSHGENRGSSPLGSASEIKGLQFWNCRGVPSVSCSAPRLRPTGGYTTSRGNKRDNRRELQRQRFSERKVPGVSRRPSTRQSRWRGFGPAPWRPVIGCGAWNCVILVGRCLENAPVGRHNLPTSWIAVVNKKDGVRGRERRARSGGLVRYQRRFRSFRFFPLPPVSRTLASS